MSNRLAKETSPYLLQHADNPVDWFPWGEEAREKAQRENKPIFLSIGYSACHWCHVMAHESFEDERVAAILSERFVSIKVDREERPDLDRIYMGAVQTLTGSGGWPMSVFLTPLGQPFHGGTYFPPTPRYGMPAFLDVLSAVADAWRERSADMIDVGRRVAISIERQMAVQKLDQREELQPATLERAYREIRRRYDRERGGWGSGPKFPQPMVLEFLLRYHLSTGDRPALEMVTETLEAMARGGMYDQLGGGFHRYSVDGQWLTPHFEKMLYDNAQLAPVYLHAWQMTGEPFYRAIAQETLDYAVREMTDPAGRFVSTQDADSEGEEGRFFVWTSAEIRGVLGEQADRFMKAYGVTEQGNFEGKSILELKGTLKERAALADARRQLFEAREGRVHPGRDDKVLTSWNGLMLAAFAEAARVLGRKDYLEIAERNGEFPLSELRTADNRLHHTWQGGEPRLNGYLEDYAYLIHGLVELYQTTFDLRWYRAAHELAEAMIEHFSAPDGGFFDTSDDHETLIVRPRELQDNAVPSGNAMAVVALSRLAGLAADPRYLDLARGTLGSMQEVLARSPLGFGQWLIAQDYILSHPREIAIVGDSRALDTRALLAVCRDGHRPHQVVAVGEPGVESSPIPLLQHRDQVDGCATAYVCVDLVCRRPVTDAEALNRLLCG